MNISERLAELRERNKLVDANLEKLQINFDTHLQENNKNVADELLVNIKNKIAEVRIIFLVVCIFQT